MGFARLKSYPTASMHVSARVSGFAQRDDGVEATVETPSGTRHIKGSYLIGCAAGRSFVRKVLDIAFEGYTHPERFLVLTTPFFVRCRILPNAPGIISPIRMNGAPCSRSAAMTPVG